MFCFDLIVECSPPRPLSRAAFGVSGVALRCVLLVSIARQLLSNGSTDVIGPAPMTGLLVDLSGNDGRDADADEYSIGPECLGMFTHDVFLIDRIFVLAKNLLSVNFLLDIDLNWTQPRGG